MGALTHSNYRVRLMDARVSEYLGLFGCVQIDGPKFCGKTWTAQNHAESQISLDRQESRDLVSADHQVALVGERPRLIDEWQEIPSLRDDVRHAIDEEGGGPGRFLLTGSSLPPQGGYSHSGAGRIARLQMHPLSSYEMGYSDGSISLEALFSGETFTKEVDTSITAIAHLVARGGWPSLLGEATQQSRRAAIIQRQYLDAIVNDEAPRKGLSPHLATQALRSLARNVATAATKATLARDMAEGERTIPTAQVVDAYLDFFRSIYLIDELPGWDVPLRGKKHLRTKPKRYFCDPSLALTALGGTGETLLQDTQLLGILFENLCLRDVMVYLEASETLSAGSVSYYRDDTGLESDIIIRMPDGRWSAIEVKLSEDKVDAGLDGLRRLRARVGSNEAVRLAKPSFLAVLVGRTSYARVVDGIQVVPACCLGV